MRKKHKMANICRSLQKNKKLSPVLKSPTHIGFIGVKKNGSKISHLGTFKIERQRKAVESRRLQLLLLFRPPNCKEYFAAENAEF
jgi:hypothetical protein